MSGNLSRAGLLIGLGLLVLAVIIGYDAFQMRVPPIHAKVGPRVFPFLVAAGLAIAGAMLMWQSRTGGAVAKPEGETDWLAVAVIVIALIVHMNILKPVGFIPAGVVLFMCVAFAFGSRKYLRDIVIALIAVSVTYFGFTSLLGLQLPPGVLQGII